MEVIACGAIESIISTPQYISREGNEGLQHINHQNWCCRLSLRHQSPFKYCPLHKHTPEPESSVCRNPPSMANK